MPRSAEQTEELANAASHGLACLLVLAAWPVLAAAADSGRPGLNSAGSSVFLVTMLLMFVVSALYHAAPVGSVKQRLRQWDHAAIFLFIAGSCTGFAVGPGVQAGQAGQAGLAELDGQAGQTGLLLAAVWVVALAGMALKLADRLRQPMLSTLLYLAFGWLAAGAALPMLVQLSPTALALLVGGGVAYSLGCWFYLVGHRVRWGHLVWHMLVICGSTCHLLALLQSGH